MSALRRFASKPAKKISYLIGNHDADLFFERVRERITRAWDPFERYPSPVVTLIADQDRIRYDEGIEVTESLIQSNSPDLRLDQLRDLQGQMEARRELQQGK